MLNNAATTDLDTELRELCAWAINHADRLAQTLPNQLVQTKAQIEMELAKAHLTNTELVPVLQLTVAVLEYALRTTYIPGRLQIITPDVWPKMKSKLGPTECILEGLIPKHGQTLLHGPPGVGKSAFIWGVLNAVSRGEPYLGLQTKQSRTLLLSFDMQVHELAARWNDVFNPQFSFICAEWIDATLPSFRTQPLYKLVKESAPELLVIDALGGLHLGRSARDDEVADGVCSALKEWLPHTAIVILGHDRKTKYGTDGVPQEPSDEDFLGSQKWRANLTNQLHMWSVGEFHSTLKHAKSQVLPLYPERLGLYINMHGTAELWNEERAKNVVGKFNLIAQPLFAQGLSVSEVVKAVAAHYQVGERTVWRWHNLAKRTRPTDLLETVAVAIGSDLSS